MSIKIIMAGFLALVALSLASLSSVRTVSAANQRNGLVEKFQSEAAIPFKGKFQGYDAVTGLDIHNASSGSSTLLGKFSMTMDVSINPSDFSDAGTAQLTAANGDILYTTVSGFAVPGPDFFTINETHTIVGGTGRFEGAEGSFTVMRLHTVVPNDDGTHDTVGSFTGSILIAKS